MLIFPPSAKKYSSYVAENALHTARQTSTCFYSFWLSPWIRQLHTPLKHLCRGFATWWYACDFSAAYFIVSPATWTLKSEVYCLVLLTPRKDSLDSEQ